MNFDRADLADLAGMWTTRRNVFVEVVKYGARAGRGGRVTRSLSFPTHLWWRSASRTLLRCEEVLRGGRGRRWLFGLVMSGSLVGCYHLLKPAAAVALCKESHGAQHSHRLLSSTHAKPQANQAFNWTLFAKYIWPDLLFLLVAVGVGLCIM